MSELASTDVIPDSGALVQYYRQKSEDRENLRMGIEWERFGVYTDTLGLVPYLGDRGYLAILKFLNEQKGWKIEDQDGEYIYSLIRGEARITVEADGKPEITSAPYASLHDLAAEIKEHQNEIDEISQRLGISWMAIGMQPFVTADQIPLIPKKRYQMWDIIFKKHREWMHIYMKMVAGTHVNFGYTSEAGLIRKTQVLYRLAPLLAAMFANSPFENGERTKCYGTRRRKIFKNGPGQEKMMPGILAPDFSLPKWIDWYLDQQVILFFFDQTIVVPPGFTFRRWLKEGYEGHFPTFFDFDQHVKTRWTDLRFRPSYLELRVFDSLPYPLLMASAAFLKGLVFDCDGCDVIEELTSGWSEELIHELHIRGCSESLHTEVQGKTFLEMVRKLLQVAAKGLEHMKVQNASGQDERIFLQPLERLLQKGISPAEDLLDFVGDDPRKILQWSEKKF